MSVLIHYYSKKGWDFVKKLNKKKVFFALVILLLIIVVAFVYFDKDSSYIVPSGSNIHASVIKIIGELGKTSPVEEKRPPVQITEKATSLSILMYHFFYDKSIGETGADTNWMEISDFEEQMKYLSEQEYYYPTWQEVIDFANGEIDLPKKSIVITIDDGDLTFFDLALPILEKYNVNATSFVITAWGGDWKVATYKTPILKTESHSHDMHKSGSDGKGLFLTISEEAALEDLRASIEVVGSSNAFCYPFGHYSDRAVEILKTAGFKAAVTTQGDKVTVGTNPYLLPRVRMAKGDSLNSFISKIQ